MSDNLAVREGLNALAVQLEELRARVSPITTVNLLAHPERAKHGSDPVSYGTLSLDVDQRTLMVELAGKRYSMPVREAALILVGHRSRWGVPEGEPVGREVIRRLEALVPPKPPKPRRSR